MEKTYEVIFDKDSNSLTIIEPMKTVVTLAQLQQAKQIMEVQLARLNEKISMAVMAIEASKKSTLELVPEPSIEPQPQS